MSESREFCPNCGEPIERPPAEGDSSAGGRQEREQQLCDDCYFERFELVGAPDRIEVLVCPTCGAVHRGNRWEDVGAADYTDVAVEEVSEALAVHVDAEGVSWTVEPEQVDQNTIRMHCYFSGVVRGRHVEAEITIPVKISRGTCTRCGRIAGDYYASTVQVRAVGRTPTDEESRRAKEIANGLVADQEAKGDREAFVTEITDTPDGPNVKVSTTKIGQQIARRLVAEFGGDFTDSATLVTQDADGNEVYRVTYAVRLPPFVAGDVLDPGDEGGPVRGRGVRGASNGVRLTTGEPFEAKFQDGDLPEATKLAEVEDAVETPLVTVEDEHAVQVLDPETYRAETISRPSYLDPDAETVPVLKTRAGLHVVPESGPEANDGE
jgi:nonsense-mediated mRNA decay protein 3